MQSYQLRHGQFFMMCSGVVNWWLCKGYAIFSFALRVGEHLKGLLRFFVLCEYANRVCYGG